jgi:hypothetical protein
MSGGRLLAGDARCGSPKYCVALGSLGAKRSHKDNRNGRSNDCTPPFSVRMTLLPSNNDCWGRLNGDGLIVVETGDAGAVQSVTHQTSIVTKHWIQFLANQTTELSLIFVPRRLCKNIKLAFARLPSPVNGSSSTSAQEILILVVQ